MQSFGAFIRYVRREKGFTQEQVAEKLNIVPPVLSKWENDKGTPSLFNLCRLCNILQLSLEDCIACERRGGMLPPENFSPETLGRNIKALRVNNGWTQAEMGKKLFVSSQTVSKWESGGVSSLGMLGSLSELFGVSPTDLCTEYGAEVKSPAAEACPRPPAPAQPSKFQPSATMSICRPKSRNTAIVAAAMIMAAVFAALILFVAFMPSLRQTPSASDGGNETSEGGSDDSQNNGGFTGTGFGGTPALPETLSFSLPVEGSYMISAGFEFWYNQTLDKYHYHSGIDLSVEAGREVLAAEDGVIYEMHDDEVLERYIKIDHGNGVFTKYIFIDYAGGMYEGKTVKKGEVIGTVAEPFGSEYKEGPHLHLEVTFGDEPVDPAIYFGLAAD